MSIDHHEHHFAINGTSIINVDSFPWFGRPQPRMKWCGSWLISARLALGATFHKVFQVLVQTRPPDVGSGHCLHADNARMRVVQLIKNLLLKTARNNDSDSP